MRACPRNSARRPRHRAGSSQAAILCLTLLGFFRFPGHTFLQSDTQIYMPILERMWDSSVLGREMLALEPHVSFTIYDEMALLLRRATGLDFEAVLVAQQLIFRALRTARSFPDREFARLAARVWRCW